MDDLEGGIQDFDFEQGLESGTSTTQALKVANGASLDGASNLASAHAANAPSFATQPASASRAQYRKNFRQTVCRHWLRGLCMKGNDCGFLHQFDKSRMPVCRFFAKWGECREPDCIYKHSNEDIKECNMYKLGFCPNGPECRYRHQKLPGPPPVPSQLLNRNPNRSHNPSMALQETQGSNPQPENYENNKTKSAADRSNPASDQAASTNSNSKFSSPQQKLTNDLDRHDPNAFYSGSNENKFTNLNQAHMLANYSHNPNPLLPVGSSRYFIVKSNNMDNLELSAKRGLWATHKNNENKLNDAFDHSDNVILIFSVNETRHFQGCAKMISRIGKLNNSGGWKCSNGISNYGKNFRIKWLKLCELSFNKTRHLRNPYNENLPVKISRDCQEVEPIIGYQLCELLFAETDSHFMEIARAAEKKLEELKSKGESELENDSDENIITPYQYNGPDEEEDEDEEDEEEDEEEGDENPQKVKKTKFSARSNSDTAADQPLPPLMNSNLMPPVNQAFLRGQMFPFNQNFMRGPGMPGNFFPGLPEENYGRNFPPYFRPDFPRPMNFRGPEMFNSANGFPGPEGNFGNMNFPMPGFMPGTNPQPWGMNFPGQANNLGFQNGMPMGNKAANQDAPNSHESGPNHSSLAGLENGSQNRSESKRESREDGRAEENGRNSNHDELNDGTKRRKFEGYGDETAAREREGSDSNSKFRRRKRFEENDEDEDDEYN